ncbi:MAG: TenA family protein [Pseudomonadota bacterium]
MKKAAEILRARHASELEEFLTHPFFFAVEQNTLPNDARDRYFVAERHFVRAARTIFAYLLLKAPDLAAARHIVSILEGLVNAQERLFDGIYDSLGLSDPVQPDPETAALAEGMTAIASVGSYGEGIAAMYVAEWTYAQVGRRGGWKQTRDPTIRDWFELHAEPSFRAGAVWLGEELDRVWTPEQAPGLEAAFRRAIMLEVAFHNGPLREVA